MISTLLLEPKFILKMKNKAVAILFFFALAVIASSCASSRKYGCPGNPQANYKWRG